MRTDLEGDGEKSLDQGAEHKQRASLLKKRSAPTLTSSTGAESGTSSQAGEKSEQPLQLASGDKDDTYFDFLDSLLDTNAKKSKVGMKHELHSDAQRIDLIYDYVHHDMPPNELKTLH